MKYKTPIIITSLILLIPMFVGFFLWNQLPEELPIHFNAQGIADNYASKPFVVFMFPLVLLALHLLCTFITLHDPKKQNINDKVFLLILMIPPMISMIGGVLSYSQALGMELSVNLLIYLFLGILFIVVGNYLPKSRQNYTVGIKLPWTLNDTENWNKTHHFAGILWMLCGVLLLVNAFFNIMLLPLIVILLAVGLPTIYSFLLHQKQEKEKK